MPILEDAVELVAEGFGGVGKIALGIGLVAVAPVAIPALRPVTKEVVKGGIRLTRKTREAMAEAGEKWGDLIAEAQSEMDARAEAEGEAADIAIEKE